MVWCMAPTLCLRVGALSQKTCWPYVIINWGFPHCDTTIGISCLVLSYFIFSYLIKSTKSGFLAADAVCALPLLWPSSTVGSSPCTSWHSIPSALMPVLLRWGQRRDVPFAATVCKGVNNTTTLNRAFWDATGRNDSRLMMIPLLGVFYSSAEAVKTWLRPEVYIHTYTYIYILQ